MVPTAELMAEPRQTPLRPAERVCKPPALYQKPPSLPEAAIFHERHSMPGTRHKYDDNPVGMPQRLWLLGKIAISKIFSKKKEKYKKRIKKQIDMT